MNEYDDPKVQELLKLLKERRFPEAKKLMEEMTK